VIGAASDPEHGLRQRTPVRPGVDLSWALQDALQLSDVVLHSAFEQPSNHGSEQRRGTLEAGSGDRA
jgi:hypothetical protein